MLTKGGLEESSSPRSQLALPDRQPKAAVATCLFDPLGSVIYLGWCRFPLRVASAAARRLLPFMDKKRILASVVVFLILAVLVYLQYRHWRSFDWGTFWSQTHRIKKIHVLHGIA